MSQLARLRFVPRSPRGARRGFTLCVLVLALLLAAQGCSDDSSGGVLTDPCIEFTPAAAPASGTVTTSLANDSTCTLATLDIVATGIDDVWSLDTTVTYDPALVAYTGYLLEDTVLESGGTLVAVAIQATDEGELTVGVSRVASDEGTDIDENGGLLVQLLFALSTTTAGSGSFTLDDDCLTTPDPQDPDGPPQTISPLSCTGGTIEVR